MYQMQAAQPAAKGGNQELLGPASLFQCFVTLGKVWNPYHSFLTQKWTQKSLLSFLENIMRTLQEYEDGKKMLNIIMKETWEKLKMMNISYR